MLKKLIVLGSLLLLTACTAAGPIGPMPVVSNEAKAGLVEVIRVSSIVGATNSYKIAFDDRDIISIRTGQHAGFRADPGVHKIAVKCFGGWSPTWKEAALQVTIQSSYVHYFRVSPGFRCAKIEKISRERARELKQTSEKINLSAK